MCKVEKGAQVVRSSSTLIVKPPVKITSYPHYRRIVVGQSPDSALSIDVSCSIYLPAHYIVPMRGLKLLPWQHYCLSSFISVTMATLLFMNLYLCYHSNIAIYEALSLLPW